MTIKRRGAERPVPRHHRSSRGSPPASAQSGSIRRFAGLRFAMVEQREKHNTERFVKRCKVCVVVTQRMIKLLLRLSEWTDPCLTIVHLVLLLYLLSDRGPLWPLKGRAVRAPLWQTYNCSVSSLEARSGLFTRLSQRQNRSEGERCYGVACLWCVLKG